MSGGPGGAPDSMPDSTPDSRREEGFAHCHSADTSETLFSTGAEDDRSTGARDRLAGDQLSEAVEVMARIRRDGDWESAQTHASLLPYLLEESWELVDAVADGDRDELVSELGDLLLQVLFHSAIGAERVEGAFDIHDVAGALLDKLRRRAPYWFVDEAGDADDAGDADHAAGAGPRTAEAGPKAAGLDAAEQDRLWQQAKAAERAGRPPRGVVDGIPWDMPALALGQKVLARARSAGIPDDLVPEGMRVVRVDPAGLFRDRASGDESGSAEVEYRQVVRRFADDIRLAESRLAVPVADSTAADWHAAWPA